MQVTEESLNLLAQYFQRSLQPEPEIRKQAEAYLKQLQDQPGYGLNLLTLLNRAAVDEQIRQAAAVNFKNFVKYRWNPTDQDVERLGALVPIQDGEKEEIKQHIVRLMLTAPPKIQTQLSDTLASISSHDFPSKWQNLLPDLVIELESQDYTAIIGVLETANSIFKRFRFQFQSEELFSALKYCLDIFPDPLLALFLRIGEVISSSQNNVQILKPAFECQRLICRIFFSLNYQVLPEVFEDKMREWMGEFHKWLAYENPLLVEQDAYKESVLDQVKACICENINLYIEKYEEEFGEYLPIFASVVWALLTHVGLSAKHDHLAVTAMKFLTTVSTSVHHKLFNDETTLRHICEGIVIPNLTFREEDEELFEINPVEYIRRDMEGSDSDTRRRMACELVKGLTENFEPQVVSIFKQHVGAMLQKYAQDPEANWKAKDCAMYLVVALTVKRKTAAGGATCVNPQLDPGVFMHDHVLPELAGSSAADVNQRPVIKADALKFLTTFRSQVSKQVALELMPHLVRYLGAESNVVHSYAANCVERLLVIRDNGRPRFGAEDLNPYTNRLLTALFEALRLPESQENQYVMKCIMRVLSTVHVAAMGPPLMQEMAAILMRVCQNPTNPSFNHYLFEAVAALIRTAGAADASQVPHFEAALFPVLQSILEQDVQEFAPYAFQVLALLVEMRPAPLPPAYLQIFPALTTPLLWERNANVPALVRLLQAYLQKAAPDIVKLQQLPKVLGVFQKLIASKYSDQHGFFILNTLIEHLSLGPDGLGEFMNTIWGLLFHRLQHSKTPKLVKGLLVFMALFVVKHGTTPLVASVNAIQPQLFLGVVEPVWVAALPQITGEVETKLCAVAAARLLTEVVDLQSQDHTWGRLLDATLTLLVRPEEERAELDEEADVPDLEAVPGGFAAVYAQLHNAGKADEDPVKEIVDAKEYVTKALSQVCMRMGGKFNVIIQTVVQPANREELARFCHKYNVSLG